MGFKNYFCYIFLLIASTALLCVTAFAVVIGSPPTDPVSANSSQFSITKSEDRQGFSKFIDKICLYEVIRGERRKTLLGRKDFDDKSTSVSDGYVCGVELFSRNGNLSTNLEEHSKDILSSSEGNKEKAVSVTGKTLPVGKLLGLLK